MYTQDLTLGRLAFEAVSNMVCRPAWNDSIPYIRPPLSAAYFRQYESILEFCDESGWQHLYATRVLTSAAAAAAFLKRCSGSNHPIALDSKSAFAAADRVLDKIWVEEQALVQFVCIASGESIDAETWAALPELEKKKYASRKGSNYQPQSVARLLFEVVHNQLRCRWNWNMKPDDWPAEKKWKGNPEPWVAPPLSRNWRDQFECPILLTGDAFWMNAYQEKVLDALLDGEGWMTHCSWNRSSNRIRTSADEDAVPGE
jgi:hypothetical protein